MKEMENIQARFLKSFFSLCLEADMGTDFRERELRGVNKKETGKRCGAAAQEGGGCRGTGQLNLSR